MDYSLLIVIEKTDQQDEKKLSTESQNNFERYSLTNGTVFPVDHDGYKNPVEFGLSIKKRHIFRNGNRIYHVAIIDYL